MYGIKKVIMVLFFILSFFKTSSTKYDAKPYEKKELIKCNVIANKCSIFNYVLSKTNDSLFSVRITSIIQTETGFKSNVLKKYNNVCGYSNQYGYKSYNHIKDSIDELIDYEIRKGNKSWYYYTHKQFTEFHRNVYRKIYKQNLKILIKTIWKTQIEGYVTK